MEPVTDLVLFGSDLTTVQLIGLAVMSLLVGVVGGIVGIALGVVRLPVMTAVGLDPLMAASTNLFVSVLGSVAGSWPAILQNRIVFRVVIVIGIPAIAGSFVGGAGVGKDVAALLNLSGYSASALSAAVNSVVSTVGSSVLTGECIDISLESIVQSAFSGALLDI